MDEARFLARILAEPADDSPRLMYADWLEERADPRGEFIRLQCERAAIGDGAALDKEASARWRMLVERETELLAAHGALWSGPISELAPTHQFERGFVESIELPADDFLGRAEKLFALAPIRRVALTGNLTKAARRWRSLGCLKRIERLSLRGNLGINQFAKELASAADHANLRELAIELCLAGTAAVRSLAFSSRLTGLTKLTFRDNMLGDESIQALAVAQNLAGLRSLTLANNHSITAAGVGALATSSFLSKLESLNLENTSAGNGAAAYLAFSPNLRNLKTLNLSSALEGGPGAILPLADSAHLPRLETLSLSGDRLGDEGVEAIAQSRQFESLRFLDISYNGVSKRGAGKLAHWPRLRNLAVLDLRGNPIDASSVATLRESGALSSNCVLLTGMNRTS